MRTDDDDRDRAWSDLPENVVAAAFARRRFRQQVLLFVALPVGALAILCRVLRLHRFAGISDLAFVLALLGFVGAGLLFSWLNWRCPACDKYLGESLKPGSCAKCGTTLHRPKPRRSARRSDGSDGSDGSGD